MTIGTQKSREIQGASPQESLLASIGEWTSSARTLASSVKEESRLSFARTAVYCAVREYWQKQQYASSRDWPLREAPFHLEMSLMSREIGILSTGVGCAAAKLKPNDASYAIGVLYTAMMPGGFRTNNGAYYTPPALCEELLDMATDAGVDWRSARVLDPACGGGAFLSPVARRMAECLEDIDALAALKKIQCRLRGFELDPFAAWMSQVFLDVTLGELCSRARTRLRTLVHVCDSLEQENRGQGFDLVVGNPPYGRLRLPPHLRNKFKRSLFGHANLYGVFSDLALRFVRPGGVIAYVTPTSFLAGEYFKSLRGLLGCEAPPVNINFVGERKGVFADALQETLLAAYKRGSTSSTGKVHFIFPGRAGSFSRKPAGSFNLPDDPSQPWLMPRTAAQSPLARQADEMPNRLVDYGYTVSTGPLVWNRHKHCLRDQPGDGRYPLIWAESVRPGGVFSFRADRRNHKPYFEPGAKENWVITELPCVLLQRTTAMEQSRRLIAAKLPVSFIREHGAVVIENHLNIVKPLNGTPKVAPATLAVLFNSDVVDQVFRCINGSAAVSAYELKALPLPAPEEMEEFERKVNERASRAELERAIIRLYGQRAG